MFCQSCGTQLAEGATPCVKCGYEPPSAGAAVAADISSQVKASSKDAAGVLRQLALDPVGGLSEAFTGLGTDRALSAGVALCVAFALCASGGLTMAMSRLEGMASAIIGSYSGLIVGQQGLSSFLKTAGQLLVVPVAIVVVSMVLRRIAGARAPVAADIFTAGAALAPLGAAALLAGILGAGNIEIVLLLVFFALTLLVLMLYAGFTKVGGMTERAAAPAVPAALLLAAWLCKVAIAAMI